MASFLRQLPRQSCIASLRKTTTQVSKQPIATCQILRQAIHTTSLTPDADKTFSSSASVRIPPPQDIYRHNDKIESMTNEELNDPTTIPGFLSLIHSPPLDRASTPRNALVGTVVSDKMQKTVNVEVDRYKIIPKYRKRMKYSKKFMAHDEHEVCKEGDLVMITPCQRISRKKHFRVHEIIKRKGGVW